MSTWLTRPCSSTIAKQNKKNEGKNRNEAKNSRELNWLVADCFCPRALSVYLFVFLFSFQTNSNEYFGANNFCVCSEYCDWHIYFHSGWLSVQQTSSNKRSMFVAKKQLGKRASARTKRRKTKKIKNTKGIKYFSTRTSLIEKFSIRFQIHTLAVACQHSINTEWAHGGKVEIRLAKIKWICGVTRCLCCERCRRRQCCGGIRRTIGIV